MTSIDYTARRLLPEHIRDGLRRYIENGRQPGHFLTAVLSNDLREACARADDVNRYRLFDIVSFLHNYAPRNCWGSPEHVADWIKAKTKRIPSDD